MALQQITQEEVDRRLLSHSYPDYIFVYDEEERENFRPPNYFNDDPEEHVFDPSRSSSGYQETEDTVSRLSSAAQMVPDVDDDLYQIFESHFPNAWEYEQNSYEDYLYRQEVDQVANKKDGLPEEIISQFVRSRICHEGDLLDMCVVCQSEYERREILGSLGCGHEYHLSCIRRWLTEKNCCPVCKRTAVNKKKRKERLEFDYN